ncbi:MAG TPA: hypothetical protein VLH10_11505, partial [Yinghuangia sp.]|nr:hypothetical protein [Yinghuangia sp.]
MRRIHRAGSAVLLSLAFTVLLVPSAGSPLVDVRSIDARPVAVDAGIPEARPAELLRAKVPPVDVLAAAKASEDRAPKSEAAEADSGAPAEARPGDP